MQIPNARFTDVEVNVVVLVLFDLIGGGSLCRVAGSLLNGPHRRIPPKSNTKPAKEKNFVMGLVK